MNPKRPLSPAALKSLPTKWAVGIILVLIAYGLLQPVLNARLGWQLPALAELGQSPTVRVEPPSATTAAPQDDVGVPEESQPGVASSEQASSSSVQPTRPPQQSAPPQQSTTAQQTTPARQSTPTQPSSSAESTSQTASRATDSRSQGTVAAGTPALRYGLLRETAPDDFLSPAGLRYTRGSAEGHRLRHIERHLQDDPGRPGKHGVFDGDMPQVLRWIDEAYSLAQRGAKGTRRTEEDGRTVYEASFSKPIGYIGGRDGRAANHPDCRRLRLVVEGTKVITAFPF